MLNEYKVSEFSRCINELFEKTSEVYDLISMDYLDPWSRATIALSESYALSEKVKLFLALTDELDHYEISTLLSNWNQAYRELKNVIVDKDSNTSWAYSNFESYKDQNETVMRMLKNIKENV